VALGLIIIKPVGNQCNLRCDYCYAICKDKKIFMSMQTLEQIIKSFATLNSLPIFFWGGGEPLLAGINFFEKVIDLQSKYYTDKSFINSFQTNGVLLNKKWIDFIKQHNFQIGISWDGFNDLSRTTIKGSLTANKVWEKIELCCNEKINFGIITVMTQQNIKQLPQVAKFLYSKGIKNLLCKPYVGQVKKLSLNSTDYLKVMNQLLDLWLETKDKDWVLEPVYSFVKSVVGDLNNIGCEFINDCGNFLTIQYNGDVTCCDFISQCFVFGNIHKMNLNEIINSPIYKSFVNKTKIKPKKCVSCFWKNFCGGGCLHYRNFNDQFQKWGKYIFCESRKILFNQIKSKEDKINIIFHKI